ncbi:hypothetical protein thsps21_49220 [Pseudomonas sp. No.21]|uniref:hypothetical protein n=1 Tax=Pseudomonas TaxID=286 RepID=UPI000DA84E2A|nr:MULTISPECIES: hypothetical protein [Pseudomonas]MDU9416796.1 hypothetical protein [Pseudomonas sp. zfem005]MDW3712135.1 hypothetical protein [Pseudomonas sp. 2023EL-01195]PZE10735.1 hypothetical protein DMX10_24370 [Pseudomonas sp. 57B-090624]GJN49508.1 hypothetical protein TUM20249_54940 [Pseudomonas tohonis]
MDIERIRRKRQKNVQEQSLLRREGLRLTAEYYRNQPDELPRVLLHHPQALGIDWSRTIMVDLHIEQYGGHSVSGLLLTQDCRFIEFDLDTNEDYSKLDAKGRNLWHDVTEQTSTSRHNRGTGVSDGAWALEVQRQLNGEASDNA